MFVLYIYLLYPIIYSPQLTSQQLWCWYNQLTWSLQPPMETEYLILSLSHSLYHQLRSGLTLSNTITRNVYFTCRLSINMLPFDECCRYR